jgi:hypothetical protein
MELPNSASFSGFKISPGTNRSAATERPPDQIRLFFKKNSEIPGAVASLIPVNFFREINSTRPFKHS